MATLEHKWHIPRWHLRLNSRLVRGAVALAAITVVPLAACIALLAVQQVVPRSSYAAKGIDCARYTQLARRTGVPSPTFIQNGDRCDVADYANFVATVERHNLRWRLIVGFTTVVLMAGALTNFVRSR